MFVALVVKFSFLFLRSLLAWAPQLPFLGIYPTVETLLAQSILVLALVAALFWLWRGTQAAATYGKA